MRMNQDSESFHTNDLNLSAILIVKGFSLKEIIKSSKGKATFVFSNDQAITQTILDYWNNKLKVNPQELFNATKLLKNRIYSNY